ncbi:hypothetical protein DPEC_G00010880 [Dallia pectoralis]|uniref:Uncharacterized protein n=1 Tax=Dallia pectoralis TaxID=75939 RepID=A0ACC2HM60_DALPE|nr:hypothetical protein DPEC_G00010880 [Dallia pectoralis]
MLASCSFLPAYRYATPGHRDSCPLLSVLVILPRCLLFCPLSSSQWTSGKYILSSLCVSCPQPKELYIGVPQVQHRVVLGE